MKKGILFFLLMVSTVGQVQGSFLFGKKKKTEASITAHAATINVTGSVLFIDKIKEKAFANFDTLNTDVVALKNHCSKMDLYSTKLASLSQFYSIFIDYQALLAQFQEISKMPELPTATKRDLVSESFWNSIILVGQSEDRLRKALRQVSDIHNRDVEIQKKKYDNEIIARLVAFRYKVWRQDISEETVLQNASLGSGVGAAFGLASSMKVASCKTLVRYAAGYAITGASTPVLVPTLAFAAAGACLGAVAGEWYSSYCERTDQSKIFDESVKDLETKKGILSRFIDIYNRDKMTLYTHNKIDTVEEKVDAIKDVTDNTKLQVDEVKMKVDAVDNKADLIQVCVEAANTQLTEMAAKFVARENQAKESDGSIQELKEGYSALLQTLNDYKIEIAKLREEQATNKQGLHQRFESVDGQLEVVSSNVQRMSRDVDHTLKSIEYNVVEEGKLSIARDLVLQNSIHNVCTRFDTVDEKLDAIDENISDQLNSMQEIIESLQTELKDKKKTDAQHFENIENMLRILLANQQLNSANPLINPIAPGKNDGLLLAGRKKSKISSPTSVASPEEKLLVTTAKLGRKQILNFASQTSSF